MHNRLMQMTTSFMFDCIICKPTSLLDPVSIPTNLLFKDLMTAWVIVATVIAAGGIAAPILAGVATWHLGRHGDHSMHGIGSMDAKFTSMQVPQFKSDLRGGAVDIVAVTVTFKCPAVLFVNVGVACHGVTSGMGRTQHPERESRAEQMPAQTRPEKRPYRGT
ncbi:hypothetical protein EDD16DRAFT_1524587 [Pisolithus croceorrhizus]|nr:hypothetical protein EDD16DRAFT_1524587 [Pisolithus croceorrhizus]